MGEIRSILAQIEEKIGRIRAGSTPKEQLSHPDVLIQTGDKFVRILGWVTIACTTLALVLFVFFKFSLASGTSELHAIAAGMRL